MNFDDVKNIFYRSIHRRYHRHCRELFSQIKCLNLNIKPAYLFDLFPFSIENMRNLLNSLSNILSFCPIILKYSLNDIIIINNQQLSRLAHTPMSVLVIDLNTMTLFDNHPMIDKIREHLAWVDARQNKQIDFDNEKDDEWADLIQSLNHTTVFGYVLGYPLIYFYTTTSLMNVNILRNWRVHVKWKDYSEETLMYSFSCPLHSNIDQTRIESVIERFRSDLFLQISRIFSIENYRLDEQMKDQLTWCL